MVKIVFTEKFENKLKKSDEIMKIKLKKQIQKIIENPEIGKPMRYNRKGTREVYVNPFRLSYSYSQKNDEIIFLTIYHKDEQ